MARTAPNPLAHKHLIAWEKLIWIRLLAAHEENCRCWMIPVASGLRGDPTLYKAAKMLRTKKDLRRAAAVKTSLLWKPKGKESLA
jgi:hypothetical protein